MISFDLDMTLLDHKTGKIPESAMTAIDKLRKKHKIVLATGRDMDNHYSRAYRDLIHPDGIVHTNGTKITIGDHLLFEHHFDPELLEQLLNFCEQEGYAIGMTVGDEDYYIHPEVIRAHDIRRWGSCGRQFKDVKKLPTLGVRSLAFIGTPEQIAHTQAEFPMLRLPTFAGGYGADVIEKEHSKANGLVKLARYWGEPEDLSTTVAFGDSMNDIEVIQAAGIGVAMGNAIEELKQVADYTTNAIHEDGIYNACIHLGLF